MRGAGRPRGRWRAARVVGAGFGVLALLAGGGVVAGSLLDRGPHWYAYCLGGLTLLVVGLFALAVVVSAALEERAAKAAGEEGTREPLP